MQWYWIMHLYVYMEIYTYCRSDGDAITGGVRPASQAALQSVWGDRVAHVSRLVLGRLPADRGRLDAQGHHTG